MPLFKCTQIFALDANGWSETWYSQESTAQLAAEAFNATVAARARMLSRPATVQYVRVSDEAITGDALFASYEATETIPDKTVESLPPDNVLSAWLCRFSVGGHSRRHLWLRGAPDEWVRFLPEGRRAPADPKLLQLFDQYVASLVANRIGLRVLSPNAVKHPVSTCIPHPGDLTAYQLVIASTAGLPQAGRIRLFGFPRATGLSGVRHYLREDQTDLKVFPSKSPINFQYNGAGVVQLAIWEHARVLSGQPMRFGGRKTGRRFFVTAGRRS